MSVKIDSGGNSSPDPGDDKPAAENDAYRKKAGKAAEAFEAQFLREMLRGMKSATRALAGPDSVFSNHIAGDMQDWADGLLADQLAQKRLFGVANAILAQIAPEPAGNIHVKDGAASVAPSGQGLAAFAPALRFPSQKL